MDSHWYIAHNKTYGWASPEQVRGNCSSAVLSPHRPGVEKTCMGSLAQHTCVHHSIRGPRQQA